MSDQCKSMPINTSQCLSIFSMTMLINANRCRIRLWSSIEKNWEVHVLVGIVINSIHFFISIDRHCSALGINLSCPVRSLSLSYQQNAWLAVPTSKQPSQAFFWYDTDYRIVLLTSQIMFSNQTTAKILRHVFAWCSTHAP